MKKSGLLFLVVCLLLVSIPVPVGAQGNTINVKDAAYGAVGDGAADDTGAISRALSAAGTGDTVYIPNGNYRLTGNFTLPSGVKLEGESTEGAVLSFWSEKGSVTLSSFCEVADLTLDGNNVVIYAEGGALIGRNISGVNLHDLVIKNFNLDGPAVYFEGVQDSEIRNNKIYNIGVSTLYGEPLVSGGGKNWGAGMRIGYNSNNIRVIGNLVENTGRGGILCNEYASNLVIRDNIVRGSSINNPKINNVGGEGLGIEIHDNCSYCVVENNIVDRWLSVVRSQYIAVRNNIVDATLLPGVVNEGQDYYGLEIGAGNSVITGNYTIDHWEGMAINGIDLRYTPTNNYFADNVFDSAGQFGAEILGTDGYKVGRVSNLYFYNNQFINGSRENVTGMEGAGVSLRCNITNLTFEDCLFQNGRLGILFQQDPGLDGLYLEGCRFIGNTSGGGQDGLQPGGTMTLDYQPEEGTGFTAFEAVDCVAENNENDTFPENIPFTSDKPIASFSFETTGSGNTVRFENQSSDADGIETYLWDFGEGAPSGEENPTYTYEEDGVYTVTLIVWDTTGRASRYSQQITVGQNLPEWKYTFQEVYYERDGVSCIRPNEGDFTVRVKFNKEISGQEETYFIVAAYDESGAMLDYSIAPISHDGAAVQLAALSIPEGRTVDQMRAYLWDASGSLAPQSLPYSV